MASKYACEMYNQIKHDKIDGDRLTWQVAHSDTSNILLSAQTKALGISIWSEQSRKNRI